MAFGFIWGLVVASAVIVANQNYEAIKLLAEDQQNLLIVLGVAGFVALSLLILVVMVFSGILQALGGRRMPQRWMAIFAFFVGAACASFTLSQMPVVL
ncbi:hypothetical protein [Loktanella sp. Alg231-35]|uniref:hypothetical protein n=1 Tax=Loktanella sp. Alg231-35 TaxID=1922220 RepID=UPI00131F31AC|nr:hypothetical protein [Loktanella sp. Alg231-35]